MDYITPIRRIDKANREYAIAHNTVRIYSEVLDLAQTHGDAEFVMILESKLQDAKDDRDDADKRRSRILAALDQ